VLNFLNIILAEEFIIKLKLILVIKFYETWKAYDFYFMKKFSYYFKNILLSHSLTDPFELNNHEILIDIRVTTFFNN